MDIKQLENIFEEWTKWYNNEISRKAKMFPVLIDGNVEYISISSPIEMYCGEYGVKINEYLRKGIYKNDGYDLSFRMSMYATELTMLLYFAPKMPEDFIAYRYISSEEKNEIINPYPYKLGKSQPYLKRDFLSVTLNDKNYNNADYTKTRYMLELIIPKGIHAIYPMNIRTCKREIEQELILPKDLFICYTGKCKEMNGKIVYVCEIMEPSQL